MNYENMLISSKVLFRAFCKPRQQETKKKSKFAVCKTPPTAVAPRQPACERSPLHPFAASRTVRLAECLILFLVCFTVVAAGF
jgi:hypothetical protein